MVNRATVLLSVLVFFRAERFALLQNISHNCTDVSVFSMDCWSFLVIWSFIVTADFHLFILPILLVVILVARWFYFTFTVHTGRFFLILTLAVESWYVVVEVLVCLLVPVFQLVPRGSLLVVSFTSFLARFG